mmetsp:Transcript_12848/g.24122  ORF Transcript_12848/g.24122 Transcript_12848/m.24122 type:complete len:377 (+) Transcript_12848:161-1291(+)|eukprot:CAMPEP_0176494442 /NCGR_PEP_ID=MMETSP0200_2-20121128/10104_1 /TAXON_ID=947934 /ORGANISM="Chaetoceros sp., Strain GSL56" /LENGTH=376 /DNA_ID=CAMNT_0017892211 /DNA_START=86 /DNA_END=1216 /DNA_ORIENTATION=-
MFRFSDRLIRPHHERIPQNEHLSQDDNLAHNDEEAAAMMPASPEERIGSTRTHSMNNLIENQQRYEETQSLQQPELASSASQSESQTVPEEAQERSDSEEDAAIDDLSRLIIQRNYHRRGTKICTFILALFLFRLWIEALLTLNVILIIFSSFMTSYLFAWRVHRSSIEYELNQEIDEMQRNSDDPERGETNENLTFGRRRSRRSSRNRNPNARHHGGLYNFDDWDFGSNRDHIDLEMLGFQAQLAIAIMESQRHILETGGYGRPDGGEDESQIRGVSDETKAKWKAFSYNPNDPKVKECADLKTCKNDEPSCCICLCEYEEGEMLNQLDCGHVYHQECIQSWCQNHTRCPLCNLDLEDSSNIKNGDHDANGAEVV